MNCYSDTTIVDDSFDQLGRWITSFVFSIDIETASRTIPAFHILSASLTPVLASPFQTPSTLFCVLVFIRRFSDANPGFVEMVQKQPVALLHLIKIFFCIATDIHCQERRQRMPLSEKLELMGYAHDKYLEIRDCTLSKLGSPLTGLTEVSAVEWMVCHAFMPRPDCSMDAVHAFMDWTHWNSPNADTPLRILYQRFAIPDSPSPSCSTEPLSSSGSPSSCSSSSIFGDSSSDDSDRSLSPEGPDAASRPASPSWIQYGKFGGETRVLYQPRPRRPIHIDALQWGVDAEEVEFSLPSRKDEKLWRGWTDNCLGLDGSC